MDRLAQWSRLQSGSEPWDIVIIGGGATGLGCALDAALRGYRTALFERHDFAEGTSSRSTKLVHGGVRYLKQGDLRLVREALRERGRLERNAPGLVHRLGFVIPARQAFDLPFYRLGLGLYDALAGAQGFGRTRALGVRATLESAPGLDRTGLRGGVLYFDGQFDDARLAIALARAAHRAGAVVLNHAPVHAFLRSPSGAIEGVTVSDAETGFAFDVRARVTLNCAGIFADSVARLADPRAPARLAFARGTHLVVGAAHWPGPHALMVPRTDDGRVLFAVPWLGRVVVGTTDVPVRAADPEPRPSRDEIDFLLGQANRYLARPVEPSDIRSVFAGIRPLRAAAPGQNTAELSRRHAVEVGPPGLVTVSGGKWTTYRQMAEEAVGAAAACASLPARSCSTASHPLPETESSPLTAADRALGEAEARLHPDFPYRFLDVIRAVRLEGARTVADVLSRRLRLLPLDARAALAAAPAVAALMGALLQRKPAWAESQVRAFSALAQGSLPDGAPPDGG